MRLYQGDNFMDKEHIYIYMILKNYSECNQKQKAVKQNMKAKSAKL